MSKNKQKSKKEYWLNKYTEQRASEIAAVYDKRLTREQSFIRGYRVAKENTREKVNKLNITRLDNEKSNAAAKERTDINTAIKEQGLTSGNAPIENMDQLINAFTYEKKAAAEWTENAKEALVDVAALKQEITTHNQLEIARLTDLSTMQTKLDKAEKLVKHYKAVLKDQITGGK
jgi:hypothetical protein|tara:strand:- start:122 stop:646 length:525 start_codon:yes stop_codon:yes gene_type:complete